MEKYFHVQTVLPSDTFDELKRKTGEKTTKDALMKAIEHYLFCPFTDTDPITVRLEKVKKEGGR